MHCNACRYIHPFPERSLAYQHSSELTPVPVIAMTLCKCLWYNAYGNLECFLLCSKLMQQPLTYACNILQHIRPGVKMGLVSHTLYFNEAHAWQLSLTAPYKHGHPTTLGKSVSATGKCLPLMCALPGIPCILSKGLPALQPLADKGHSTTSADTGSHPSAVA